MGKSVPRIYASLDNKQEEFQSHMIEVEGMINNQTIVILIDIGATHSYIYPNMVKRMHFQEENMENIGWCSWLPDPKEKLLIWSSHAQWT
jgi:hypothetical protein